MELHYRFTIFPIIFPVEKDHRRDKKSDFVVLKIVNKRTLVIIELKLSVGTDITGGDKDNISQLLYEAYLVCKKESKYQKLLCTYANQSHWHFFIMDMGTYAKPHCTSYYKLDSQLVDIIVAYFHFLINLIESYFQFKSVAIAGV